MESIPLTGYGHSDFPALFKFSGKDFPICSFRIRVLAHERSVSHFLEMSREAFSAEKTSISPTVPTSDGIALVNECLLGLQDKLALLGNNIVGVGNLLNLLNKGGITDGSQGHLL